MSELPCVCILSPLAGTFQGPGPHFSICSTRIIWVKLGWLNHQLQWVPIVLSIPTLLTEQWKDCSYRITSWLQLTWGGSFLWTLRNSQDSKEHSMFCLPYMLISHPLSIETASPMRTISFSKCFAVGFFCFCLFVVLFFPPQRCVHICKPDNS